MSVHYKFNSGKETYTVSFDGMHISVADLKKAIMQQRKIGKSADLDLEITNAQTKEVYKLDSSLIPKNTSVIVARVPFSGNTKKTWDKNDSNSMKGTSGSGHVELDKITKSSNLSTSYASEDEKIKAMMSQSTQEYDPSKYVKNKGIVGPLPANYTCYRCGQPGHYIKQCPTNNTDVKRSTGIPRSFMIPASADQKGALLTASGEYAVPIIDHEAYKEVKKEKPPFLPSNETDDTSTPEIPDELKCTLCGDLLNDAVLIPCCGNSYCDECVRSVLLESENHECPTCHEANVSPDTLIPNRYLRLSVIKFKNDTGYNKEKSNAITNETNVDVKQSEAVETNQSPAVNCDNIESHLDSNGHQSPVKENDVTIDEVLLGSPKKEDLNFSPKANITIIADEVREEKEEDSVKKMDSPEMHKIEVNETREESKDSQPENTTRSSTPLVDEPTATYETNEHQMEINPIETLQPYQHMMPMHAYRPPRMMAPIVRPPIVRSMAGVPTQNSVTLLGRGPVVQRSYPPMTRHPQAYTRYPMPMPPAMHPYGYQPLMLSANPYGYMGPRMHAGPMHQMGFNQSMTEAPPPGTTPLMPENSYYAQKEFDEYEEKVNRFTRQLESRDRRRRRNDSRSRSRSRSPTRSRSLSSKSSDDSDRHKHHRRKESDEFKNKVAPRFTRQLESRDRRRRRSDSRSRSRSQSSKSSDDSKRHKHHYRKEFDEYKERMNRFARQLESRDRKNRRNDSRSRSRSRGSKFSSKTNDDSKRHKHHHHRHRKGSNDSKDKSDESKSQSKKKCKHKRNKHSNTKEGGDNEVKADMKEGNQTKENKKADVKEETQIKDSKKADVKEETQPKESKKADVKEETQIKESKSNESKVKSKVHLVS